MNLFVLTFQTKKILLLIFISFIISCKSTKIIDKVTDNSPLNFVNSKNYHYTTNKKDIRSSIIDSLKQFNDGKYYLGDSSEANEINLTDVGIPGLYRYDKFLHFALVNGSVCLLVYTQGGRGAHTVVDFVQDGNQFICSRYRTLEKIADVKTLKIFLETNPVPAVLSSK